MAVNVDDKIKKLSRVQRKKVEVRAAELIAEEMTLRELRKARKLTQVRIAKALGVIRSVRFAKSLVVPLVGAGLGERPLVDYFALLAINVRPRFVWIACRLAHKNMCHIAIRFARP